MAIGYTTMDSLFTVASAVGNVGLSTVSMTALPAGAKSLIMLCMYLGRIEILPSLVLLKHVFPK